MNIKSMALVSFDPFPSCQKSNLGNALLVPVNLTIETCDELIVLKALELPCVSFESTAIICYIFAF